MSRFAPLLILMAASLPTEASAVEADPQWMVTITGGATRRVDDQTREYGSLAITRKLGQRYVSLSVTQFDSAVRQVDVTLPSTYTLGFLAAGGTRGPWFYDGYVTLGRQRYNSVITDLGKRSVEGSTYSPVYGAGGDLGYVKWFSPTLSLTPSASVQWIKSRALREQIGPTGPSEYETRETGATVGAGARLDRFFGPARARSVSFRVTRFETNNASAALSSGARGAIDATSQSGRGSDGWIELGASASWRVNRSLYLDAGASRTIGAVAGNMTTGAVGARVLF